VAPVSTDLRLLTGDTAGELMTAVLAPNGGRLLTWAPRQVDHRPGRRTTVSYSARVRWSDGSVTDETLGASSGTLPDGVVRLTDGTTEIGMWRFPFDPDLPALAAACDPERMRRLAADVGLTGGGPGPDGAGPDGAGPDGAGPDGAGPDGAGTGGPGPGGSGPGGTGPGGTEPGGTGPGGTGAGDIRLTIRAYRPRRRAVVEVRTPGGTVFVKVVRPAGARALHERHRAALAAGCPVPAPLGWTDDGLVALAALPGRTLRELLTGAGPVELNVDEVVDLLDALPAEWAAGDPRRTWGQRAPHYAEVIAAAAPELADRARAIADAVAHDAPEGPTGATHGDFYETQLMVGAGGVSGLLDIDTAGHGERLDDAGCLLAHLSVLAQLHPDRADTINPLGLRLQRRFARDLDPAAMARRAAAVTLSLATGPHRVQERHWPASTTRRIALAERWLDHAARCA